MEKTNETVKNNPNTIVALVNIAKCIFPDYMKIAKVKPVFIGDEE